MVDFEIIENRVFELIKKLTGHSEEFARANMEYDLQFFHEFRFSFGPFSYDIGVDETRPTVISTFIRYNGETIFVMWHDWETLEVIEEKTEESSKGMWLVKYSIPELEEQLVRKKGAESFRKAMELREEERRNIAEDLGLDEDETEKFVYRD